MNLGVFLYRGGSFRKLEKEGHDKLLEYYIKRYSDGFDNVSIFSYENEVREGLPENCRIVGNSHGIPLFLYQFLMPILNRKQVRKCDCFRCFHISGTIPAVITKCFFGKKYVTTYGYLWLHTRNREKPSRWRKAEYVFGKAIEVIGLKKAENVIVTVDTTRDHIKKHVDEERIIKIPNSVDTRLFGPKKRKSGKANRIISIGNIIGFTVQQFSGCFASNASEKCIDFIGIRVQNRTGRIFYYNSFFY